MVLEKGFLKDGIPCHLLCASMAGFTAVIFGSPVDVLKTIIMRGYRILIVYIVANNSANFKVEKSIFVVATFLI